MKQVFISRNLTHESVFLQSLQQADFEVIGMSLIEFTPVFFTHLPESDWVFFYSKKAVHYFFTNLRQANRECTAKIAAIGPGTAEALEDWNVPANFIGTGAPENTAGKFLAVAAAQRVLFPRAAQSRQSIQQILQEKIVPLDLIVYQNTPRTDFELPICDWLVFTSPMNVQAYFRKYKIYPHQQILAIGDTTANALRALGIQQFTIAAHPSEEGLVAAIFAEMQ